MNVLFSFSTRVSLCVSVCVCVSVCLFCCVYVRERKGRERACQQRVNFFVIIIFT